MGDDDPSRSVRYWSNQDNWQCDRELEKKWYRLPNNATMNMRCKSAFTVCSTVFPGWMTEGHPEIKNKIVTRTVCFGDDDLPNHWGCCASETKIDVINCQSYFVYRLSAVPVCGRYCY